MKQYSKFARIYASGTYPEYSRYIANKVPDITGRLGARPESILDFACGEGTFALEAAGLGYEVWGLDRSADMIELARNKAEGKDRDVSFRQADMRDFALPRKFDLATSWFDSMNYLLRTPDLRRTLENAYAHLNGDGYFIFDVNTIYGLRVQWQEENCYIQREDSEIFEIHRTSYDRTEDVATLRITVFARDGGRWEKFEESHRERAYSLEEIEESAEKVGFVVEAVWGDLERFGPPEEESGRVWFVLHKE